MSSTDTVATGKEAELRDRLVALLHEHYGLLPVDAEGRVVRPGDQLNQEGVESLDAVVELQRLLYDNALTGFAVPAHLGGHGLDAAADRRLTAEISRFKVPDMVPLAVGLHLVVPTLLAHGTPEQHDRYIDRTLCADDVWCQLFSEPGAGSDLASMHTRAVRDGDEWVVNGQKVWTSWGRQAARGILLARTNTDAPKHRGISMFLLDMATPGIEVRPLREMTGGWQFCEVFFTDVRVPDSCLVGERDNGWAVAMSTLTTERSEGALRAHESRATKLVELAQARGLASGPDVRQSLSDAWAREHMVQWLAERLLADGASKNPSAVSLVKVRSSEVHKRIAEFEVTLEGAAAQAWAADDDASSLPAFRLAHSRMTSIAGGTNEIQRNILGERLLGLPREPQ